MRLRLGINTCFAVKRWPHPADWAPIIRDRLGLRLVQHSLDLVDPAMDDAEAGELAAALDTHRLTLHSTFTGLAAYSANLLLDPDPGRRDRSEGWFERVVRWTAVAGGRGTGGHVGAFSVPDWQDPDRRAAGWGDLRARLGRLSGVAAAAGLDWLVVENLAAAREPSTMAMIGELLQPGDEGHVPIRLCLDIGHMCVPGSGDKDRDPYAWLRGFGRQAALVQLQQSDAEGDHHWPFTPERNARGRIDADRVIEALADAGVTQMDLILEVIPPFEQDDAEVLDDLAASVDYWQEALTRLGVAAP